MLFSKCSLFTDKEETSTEGNSTKEQPPTLAFDEWDGTDINKTKIHSKFYYIADENISPPSGFIEDKEYWCYNKNAKTIRSTQGGCSGNLLHGESKDTYRSTGNLKMTSNYYYGLNDGLLTKWDENGKITDKYRYEKGRLVEILIEDGVKKE